jgi:hypothetical protein
MRYCKEIKENHYETVCPKPSKTLTLDTLQAFFQDPEECATSIVYLDSHSNGVHISSVKVTTSCPDVSLFFSESTDQTYFYVYMRMLEQIIAWSKHPRVLGTQVFNDALHKTAVVAVNV